MKIKLFKILRNRAIIAALCVILGSVGGGVLAPLAKPEIIGAVVTGAAIALDAADSDCVTGSTKESL